MIPVEPFAVWWARWRADRSCYAEYWTNGGPVPIECETFWHAYEAEQRDREQLCREGKRARCV